MDAKKSSTNAKRDRDDGVKDIDGALEFREAKLEIRGLLTPGILKFTPHQGGTFKNSKTGKVLQLPPTEWEKTSWIRMAGGFGIKFFLNNGQMQKFAGFIDGEYEGLRQYFKKNYQMELKQEDKSVKGWNWGSVKFSGSTLGFNVDRQAAFDIPLTYVSQCTTQKNEGILEFHPNDEASVSLMEMRFYIPAEGAEGDPVEAFHQNVMGKADIIQATGDALLSLQEVPSLTPRGRYELKVYPTFLQLHGKTFDYKIPYNSILRVFILPHPDGRQMFFVLSLDPPIKQGQTRYPFLILNFKKDEDPIEVDLEISDEDLKNKYDGRLERQLSGQTYEVLGRIMRGLVNRKITVPGGFKGAAGSSAVSCSYKAANGVLYPLDRSFIYVHKPALHVRFDEVSAVNFARSGGNTRSFDFEVETKNGIVHTFSSIQKDEYSRLYDFVTNRGLRVKNRGDKEETTRRKADEIMDSDEESVHDAYMERVKKEGRERDADEDDEDEDFKPPSETSDVAEEFDSAPSSTDEEGGEGEGDEEKEKKKKKKKEKRRVRDEEVGDEERKKAAKKSKPKDSKNKDPDMPKRPLTAYFIWLNENRDKIKADNPGIGITDISKKAGEMWKALSDHKKWDKMAEEAKEEYSQKMRVYNQKLKERNDADGGSAGTSTTKKKSSASASKGSPTKNIKSAEFINTDDESSSSSDSDKPVKKSKKESKAGKGEGSSKTEKDKSPVSLSSDSD